VNEVKVNSAEVDAAVLRWINAHNINIPTDGHAYRELVRMVEGLMESAGPKPVAYDVQNVVDRWRGAAVENEDVQEGDLLAWALFEVVFRDKDLLERAAKNRRIEVRFSVDGKDVDLQQILFKMWQAMLGESRTQAKRLYEDRLCDVLDEFETRVKAAEGAFSDVALTGRDKLALRVGAILEDVQALAVYSGVDDRPTCKWCDQELANGHLGNCPIRMLREVVARLSKEVKDGNQP